MGPVIWRPRSYYLKLLAIWASFGVCLYLYHTHNWNTLQHDIQRMAQGFEHKPKRAEGESMLRPSPSYESARDDLMPTTTDTPTSSDIDHNWPSQKRIAGNGKQADRDKDAVRPNGIFKEFMEDIDDDVASKRFTSNDHDDDVKAAKIPEDRSDQPAEGPLTSYLLGRLASRMGLQRADQRETIKNPPVVDDGFKTKSLPPGMEHDSKKGGAGNLYFSGLRPDAIIFSKPISELSQQELIYRFVKNKDEFLRKGERDLPMFLKERNLHWTLQNAGEYPAILYSPPPNELPQQHLPQAILIGAGKCGTRALLEFLSMHPLAVTPDPEIHYFDLDDNFAKGLDWYKSQMPLSYTNQMTIEKTPSYIWSTQAVEEISKMNPHIKLVAILRDPVERVLSQASRGSNEDVERFFLTSDNGRLRIKTESRTVDWGIYVKYLKAWMEKYPPSQLLILETQELVKNPTAEIQKVEKFLGLPPMITEANFYYNVTKGFYCMRPFHTKGVVCLPEAKGKKHLQIQAEHEKMLYDFYLPFNEALFDLLGRRFTWVSKRLVGRG